MKKYAFIGIAFFLVCVMLFGVTSFSTFGDKISGIYSSVEDIYLVLKRIANGPYSTEDVFLFMYKNTYEFTASRVGHYGTDDAGWKVVSSQTNDIPEGMFLYGNGDGRFRIENSQGEVVGYLNRDDIELKGEVVFQ